MKPFKICLKVDAVDHYVYKGKLYIVLSDGGIMAVSMNEIIDKLIDKYPEHKPLIELGYCRNNFWNSDAAKCFLSIPKVKTALMEEWDNAAKQIIFELSIDDLKQNIITKEIESEVLSIDIYADQLYLGCRKGFYSKSITDQSLIKRFDGKIYSVNAGYGNVILSLGNDGLIPAKAFTVAPIDDKSVYDSKSMHSQWTKAGGLMNYPDKRSFEFFGNIIEKNKSFWEGYSVQQFGVKKYDQAKLLSNQQIIKSENIQLGFNDRSTQYIIGSDKILASKLNINRGEITRLTPNAIDGKPRTSFGKLISGDSIAKHIVLEYEDGLILFDGKEKYVIEDDSVVNFHTYPRSKYFKDILTVTIEDSINIHAIDVFDVDPKLIFPDTNYRLRQPHYNNH